MLSSPASRAPRPFDDGFELSHVRLRSIPDLIIASFIADLR